MERSYLLLNTVLVFSHFVVTLCLHDKVTKFERLPDSKDRSNLNSLHITDYFVHLWNELGPFSNEFHSYLFVCCGGKVVAMVVFCLL